MIDSTLNRKIFGTKNYKYLEIFKNDKKWDEQGHINNLYYKSKGVFEVQIYSGNKDYIGNRIINYFDFTYYEKKIKLIEKYYDDEIFYTNLKAEIGVK